MIITIPAKAVKPLAHLGEEFPRPAPVSCCAPCSAMLGTPSTQAGAVQQVTPRVAPVSVHKPDGGRHPGKDGTGHTPAERFQPSERHRADSRA
ncbi:hypothetical protein GCM10010532_072050 [Dactylosporangium siamense]